MVQESLVRAGLRCFRDVTHIAGTEEWRSAITQAIRGSHVYLALLSADDRDYLAEEDGAIEADCVFCGNHYRFTSDELLSEEERLPS